jgi:hypothetical protein
MTDVPSSAPDDPLAQLRDRIHATREAAERLAEEASEAVRAERERRVPPSGWATQEERNHAHDELQALVGLLEALRDLVPPELQQQLRELIRQSLLLIRAIIDWWVERIDALPDPQPEIEDIPVA